MKCIKCGSTMILDDEDYQFKGCFDQYLYCPNCEVRGFRKVRYNKCILEEQSVYDTETDESKIIFSHNPSRLDGGEFNE